MKKNDKARVKRFFRGFLRVIKSALKQRAIQMITKVILRGKR